MRNPVSRRLKRLCQQIAPALTGPPALAFLPALTLGAFWWGGEHALLAVALGLPLALLALGAGGAPAIATEPRDRATGLMLRDEFDRETENLYEQTMNSGLRSSCFVVELDEFREFSARHGQEAADQVLHRTGERILSALRHGDIVARTGDSRFAICLTPVRQLDLETCIALAGRMQAAVEEPAPLGGLTVYVSCSIGFCLRNRAPGDSAADWRQAAAAALNEAQQTGPSAIRAFSAEMQQRRRERSDLRDDAAAALETGQIRPWFQPQICTDTGRITGFEALARWTHPAHGMVSPDRFLPEMEQAGLLSRLGQVILYHAFTALKAWDCAGVDVPRVGINFTTAELRDPGLLDRIGWELDRFDLTPDRLAVEVLESVVSDCDDIVARNIAGLAELGCRIDLDDFGTGNASIAAIRRFAVSRIKIDRSFVTKADRDPDQHRLLGAILTMAERLGLETLAEGVETVGEHALLAQLGCDHVQGFGIGRPMPFDQTLNWIAAHRNKLNPTPQISRSAR
ncbi:putative bifunctional diguanylate cyclase/phosphodiesterase [Pukyongiella litopenaei]|uniref:Bifunctional diguanylate cyclase/phosphodiesterase n=1 Tax=Pukyongiella litopenaei TaxID=2605946 RepID=A0A2S0MRL2_9RHOB|nr:bifunctional diguanylate cyclase/phosphodiesterase [Pukyongiella litopenaei]AVO38333.1 bifunctional diguanylate cyclase/phosphodiesterase [Pukyongiella litopenaei]